MMIRTNYRMKSSRKMSSMVSQVIQPTAKYIQPWWWLHHTTSNNYDSSAAAGDKDMLIGKEEILSDGGVKRRRRSEQCRPPQGWLAVYVGPEERRYVIPTRYLRMPEFGELMERVAEEYGYEHQGEGGLRIPNCQIEDFEKMIQLAS